MLKIKLLINCDIIFKTKLAWRTFGMFDHKLAKNMGFIKYSQKLAKNMGFIKHSVTDLHHNT